MWPADIPRVRLAAHVQLSMPVGCRVALLGLPDDLGVRLNQGRPGAAEGPRAFRAALARYGVAHPSGWEWPRVFDAGDVVPAPGTDESALHETHRRVSAAARHVVGLGLFPVAIGGGHDLTLAFVRGVVQGLRDSGRADGPIPGLYADAHLDVRENVGSGMPFRRLIEEGLVDGSGLICTGMNPFANAREHVAWFRERGGRLCEPGQVPAHVDAVLGSRAPGTIAPRPFFCSIDTDVLDASIAPGVSALNPQGLTVAQVAAVLTDACSRPSLACLDFMELCPPHDEQGRTARVTSHLFLTALRALLEGPLGA